MFSAAGLYGEKKWQCPLCGKLFGRKQHLRDHGRVHTAEKPFTCLVCPQKFSFKCNFKRHMKRQHPGVADCWVRSEPETNHGWLSDGYSRTGISATDQPPPPVVCDGAKIRAGSNAYRMGYIKMAIFCAYRTWMGYRTWLVVHKTACWVSYISRWSACMRTVKLSGIEDKLIAAFICRPFSTWIDVRLFLILQVG